MMGDVQALLHASHTTRHRTELRARRGDAHGLIAFLACTPWNSVKFQPGNRPHRTDAPIPDVARDHRLLLLEVAVVVLILAELIFTSLKLSVDFAILSRRGAPNLCGGRAA
jgi:hypothetical protein